MITPSSVKDLAEQLTTPIAADRLLQSYRLGDVVLWATEHRFNVNPVYSNSTLVYAQVGRPHSQTLGQKIFDHVYTTRKLLTYDEIFELLQPGEQQDRCCIHLRLSDKLTSETWTPLEELNKQPEWYKTDHVDKFCKWYRKETGVHVYENNSALYWEFVHRFVKQNNIPQVTICVGSHITNHTCTYPTAYAMLTIKQWLQERDINVQFRIGLHPDEDLKFLCTSKYMLGTAGMFSRLAYKLSKSSEDCKFDNAQDFISKSVKKGIKPPVDFADGPEYTKVLKNHPHEY